MNTDKTKRSQIPALLIYDQEQPLDELQAALDGLSVPVVRARSCLQAAQLLERAASPCLIFTDTKLPDGTWSDVLNTAARARVAANVIVVARLVNIRFYVDVIERGAFDFITPPFTTSDLSHVVRCATANLVDRSMAQARSA